MKRFIVLLCLILISASCSKKPICNKFIVNAELHNNVLRLSIDSDLPNFTDISITVSRSFSTKGDFNKYPIDYFDDSSNLKKWKKTQNIFLDNSKWQDDFLIHRKTMINFGNSNYEVNDISNNIRVVTTVHAKQSNYVFGEKNINLEGSEVKKGNINVVRKVVEIVYPIEISKSYKSNAKKKAKQVISKGYKSNANKKVKQLNGKWIDNSGAMNGVIHVYNKNGIIHVDTRWSDGSTSRQTATVKTIKTEKRYYVSDSADNEYFFFGKSNEMRWYDSFGLFEVYQKK